MIIGTVAHPRVFRANKIKKVSLTVIWKSNKKAWMRADIFFHWLIDMRKKKYYCGVKKKAPTEANGT